MSETGAGHTPQETQGASRSRARARGHASVRDALLFFGIAVVWIFLDRLSKGYFDSGAFHVGEHIAGPFLGLFRFTLVHNTGAAWGIFSDSTVALAVFSLAVCAAILLFAFRLDSDMPLVCKLGLALVFAGGIGNAVDRLSWGYVVDFIDFSFMDFPVFNIADIGVTCGIVLFLVCYLVACFAHRGDDA